MNHIDVLDKIKKITLKPKRIIEIRHSDGEQSCIFRFSSECIPKEAKIISANLRLTDKSDLPSLKEIILEVTDREGWKTKTV